MTQEVQIILTGEFDAKLSKESIAELVQKLLKKENWTKDLMFTIKEEADIYGTRE